MQKGEGRFLSKLSQVLLQGGQERWGVLGGPRAESEPLAWSQNKLGLTVCGWPVEVNQQLDPGSVGQGEWLLCVCAALGSPGPGKEGWD